jgi:CBS domain-containing protein
MKTVKDVLNAKNRQVSTISPNSTVFEAIWLMADEKIGSLLVMEGEKLLGIITERDYARKVIIEGKSSRELPVKEIMSTKIVVVKPENTMEECLALMTEKRIRHLPVVEHDKVVGIISIGDAVKAVIDDLNLNINTFLNFITGG